MRESQDLEVILNTISKMPVVSQYLEQLSRENLRTLAASSKLIQMQPLDVVCRIGDFPSYVYFIVDGEVTAVGQKA